jgi:hypothetical protein
MSALGRWAAVDPQAAKFPEWGGYSYALDNPVALTDPDGECPIPLSSCAGRGGVDLAAGFTPGVSTAADAATVVTGRNPITGERVGLLGRAVALVGLLTPLSGAQIRAVGSAAEVGMQVARHADEASDATRVVTKLGDDAAQAGGRTGSSEVRFIAEPNGQVVDTRATPQGSYRQPDGSRTDVLQQRPHTIDGERSYSHTHPQELNVAPDGTVYPKQGQVRLPTAQEVSNIQTGTATRLPPRGRR